MNSRRRVNSTVRQHLTNMSALSVIVLVFFAYYPGTGCPCTKAMEDDLPHGGNMVVEFRSGNMKRITGRVFDPAGASLSDVVVEVYDLPNTGADAYHFVREHTRRTACITGADGSFCFSDLPSGKYLLRAGTRSQRDMNEVYMKVIVDRGWFAGLFRRSKPIKLELSLGT
jgi:hypothetical protein